MGFRDFLKDDKALKGFMQLCVVIFALILSVIMLLLLFRSEDYLNRILPLLTFILGALFGGMGSYIWGKKKNE